MEMEAVSYASDCLVGAFRLNIGAYTEYFSSATTPSQATPSQAGDLPAWATASPSEEPPAPADPITFSAATVRAAAAAVPSSVAPVIFPPSMHSLRPASPENEFPNLLDFGGDEDEDGFVSEDDEQPPATPRHPRIDRSPLCPPSAQGRNPVTPARRLGQTPGRSHTSRRRTQYRDGPAGSKKRHTADDAWKFFLLENDRRECLLCK